MKKEILFQLDIAWQLFEYHCHNLSEEEAMWCKTNQGLQIRKVNGVTANHTAKRLIAFLQPSKAWLILSAQGRHGIQ